MKRTNAAVPDRKDLINMIKQTAGRDALEDFAPEFARMNDDVLFGEVWSREDKLSLRDRSLVTLCVFMGKGMVDNSLKDHLVSARKNGILCRLAECMGGISYGKRGLCR